MDKLYEAFGFIVLYGGGAIGIAVLLFKTFSVKWIESKFSERLNSLKYEQDKEIQRLSIKINSMLNGALKLQEHEFRVLPNIWMKLNKAYFSSKYSVSPLQQYDDLERMTLNQLEDFLGGANLDSYQKEELRSVKDKNELYRYYVDRRRSFEAKIAIQDFQWTLYDEGIFLPEDIVSACKKIKELLIDAVITKGIGLEEGDHGLSADAWRQLETEAEPLLVTIEHHIRTRLRFHAPVPSDQSP